MHACYSGHLIMLELSHGVLAIGRRLWTDRNNILDVYTSCKCISNDQYIY